MTTASIACMKPVVNVVRKIDEVILILTNLRTGWEGLSAKLG
jgi:flagellin-specific chaperone FliS